MWGGGYGYNCARGDTVLLAQRNERHVFVCELRPCKRYKMTYVRITLNLFPCKQSSKVHFIFYLYPIEFLIHFRT